MSDESKNCPSISQRVTLPVESTICCVTDADRRFLADPTVSVIEYYLDGPCFENGYDVDRPIRVFQRTEGNNGTR